MAGTRRRVHATRLPAATGVLLVACGVCACMSAAPDTSPRATCAAIAVAPETADAVTEALTADRKLTFHAVEVVTSYCRGQNTEQMKDVYSDGPHDRSYTSYLQPGPLSGTVIIENGDDLWQYDPATGRWLHQSDQPGMLLGSTSAVDLLFENYTADRKDDATVAGRRCTVYEILPKTSGNPSRRLCIDATTRLPLRTENVNGIGDLVSVSRYDSVTFDEAMPASWFGPPADASIDEDPVTRTGPISAAEANASLGFQFREPAYIPTGYKFAGAFVLKRDFALVGHMQWFDGLSVISLFKQHTGVMLPSSGWEDSQASSVTWTDGAFRYTLIGDIVPSELSRIRDSIR